eukprot:TRINITY_DN974_c0_g1_i1.p1 TRINITY_DN974_c0_g1~~TRINITY_DN974_c0_g1_i1.p1  ORF type:complete len:379 (-),score=39.84 TRINITY_DN974_c0_g1_i1:1422-2558(-)
MSPSVNREVWVAKARMLADSTMQSAQLDEIDLKLRQVRLGLRAGSSSASFVGEPCYDDSQKPLSAAECCPPPESFSSRLLPDFGISPSSQIPSQDTVSYVTSSEQWPVTRSNSARGSSESTSDSSGSLVACHDEGGRRVKRFFSFSWERQSYLSMLNPNSNPSALHSLHGPWREPVQNGHQMALLPQQAARSNDKSALSETSGSSDADLWPQTPKRTLSENTDAAVGRTHVGFSLLSSSTSHSADDSDSFDGDSDMAPDSPRSFSPRSPGETDSTTSRRSLSSFFSGKSRSFSSLADAKSIVSIQNLAKPDNPYSLAKRRKASLHNTALADRQKNFPLRSVDGAISKRSSSSSKQPHHHNLMVAMAMAKTNSLANASA